jgi:Lactonase, 7-bladed beta-propeller
VNGRTLLVVGCLNREAPYFKGARGQGIAVFSFDESTGALNKLSEAPVVDNPVYLAVHESNRCIYAVGEVPGRNEGVVAAYRLDPTEGRLSYINEQGTLGNLGTYVSFSNRPFWVKRFQTIHHYSVDVARGLALLFGIGTEALPAWDSCCPRCAFGVVLVRKWIAKQRHQPVAQFLRDMAAHFGNCGRRRLSKAFNQVAPFFGVELRSNGSRVRDVAEQHRDMPALPERLDPRRDGRRRQCNARDRLKRHGRRRACCAGDCRRRPHRCDRSQELAAVAQGHYAQFFQIAVCQFSEQNQVDVILDKPLAY